MKIGVFVETDRWITRERDENDSWDREDTDGVVNDVSVKIGSDGHLPYWTAGPFDLDVKAGDIVYVVLAVYGTGDTFGNDGGQVDVMDVFTDGDKAYELQRWLRTQDTSYIQDGVYKFSEEFEGKGYHFAWRGYFEWLQDISVYECVVQHG